MRLNDIRSDVKTADPYDVILGTIKFKLKTNKTEKYVSQYPVGFCILDHCVRCFGDVSVEDYDYS